MERAIRFNCLGHFDPNELGGYSVWFPDLPECHTDGDDLDDAVNMAVEALELVIESYIENGRALPEPTLDAATSEGVCKLLISVNVDT